jgi:hypothetical protein
MWIKYNRNLLRTLYKQIKLSEKLTLILNRNLTLKKTVTGTVDLFLDPGRLNFEKQR